MGNGQGGGDSGEGSCSSAVTSHDWVFNTHTPMGMQPCVNSHSKQPSLHCAVCLDWTGVQQVFSAFSAPEDIARLLAHRTSPDGTESLQGRLCSRVGRGGRVANGQGEGASVEGSCSCEQS